MNRIARAIGMSFRSSRLYLPLRHFYLRCMYIVPAWLIGVVRCGFRKHGVLVFTPDFPGVASRYRVVCLLNRYEIRQAPEACANSLTVHFQEATFGDSLPVPGGINGHWIDHSKSHLDAVHQRVFGYGLNVDPLSYTGAGVVKSELQALNDGRIATFPVCTAEPGNVYQRFIDTVAEDGRCQDMTVQVLGTFIPRVRLEFRPADERRFKKNQVQFAHMVEPGTVLTDVEQHLILKLARELDADVVKFDILRDRHDGRIYVVDANSEPSLPFPGSNFPVIEYWRTAIDLANVFRREVVDRHATRTDLSAGPYRGGSLINQTSGQSTSGSNNGNHA